MTPGGPRSGRSMSMVWGRESIDEAIKDSLYGCQGYDNRSICKLHYLGDIYVAEMTDKELARAKEVYAGNPAATNEDL